MDFSFMCTWTICFPPPETNYEKDRKGATMYLEQKYDGGKKRPKDYREPKKTDDYWEELADD